MNRRRFLYTASSAASLAFATSLRADSSKLTRKQRVDRALAGQEVDRPPFTFYLHYKRPTPQQEAQDHLDFHRRYNTDIVKVMNDFDYPGSTTGKWWQLKPVDSPYPKQLETLRIIRDHLNGDAYFIDTLYGPYMTAMILFQAQPPYNKLGNSREETKKVINDLHDFQRQHSDQWHTALEAITQSTINHIRRSKEIGSSGALVSIFNSHSDYGPVADYNRFSRSYDKRVLDALADTRVTVLHLHNLDRTYLREFKDFPAPVLQYSVKESNIPIADTRKIYSQTIAGGIDEIDFRKLTTDQIRAQWKSASQQAGAKYIATPGCSVPNSSTPSELSRMPQSLGALT